MNRIFVYGSLKRGNSIRGMDLFPPKESTWVGKARTTDGIFNMVDLGSFPGVIPNGEYNIFGEIYDVSDKLFSDLDKIEGYPKFYNREEFNTTEGRAWIYILPVEYIDEYPTHEESDQIFHSFGTLTWRK